MQDLILMVMERGFF